MTPSLSSSLRKIRKPLPAPHYRLESSGSLLVSSPMILYVKFGDHEFPASTIPRVLPLTIQWLRSPLTLWPRRSGLPEREREQIWRGTTRRLRILLQTPKFTYSDSSLRRRRRRSSVVTSVPGQPSNKLQRNVLLFYQPRTLIAETESGMFIQHQEMRCTSCLAAYYYQQEKQKKKTSRKTERNLRSYQLLWRSKFCRGTSRVQIKRQELLAIKMD